MNPKIVIAVVLSVVAVIGIGFLLTAQKPPAASYSHLDEFAQCLASKNVVMYGAVWCSHCQAQKKLFGDSFKYVSYVECPDNPQKCLDAKVDSYPTWVFPDGRRLTGEQKLEDLAKYSTCSLR